MVVYAAIGGPCGKALLRAAKPYVYPWPGGKWRCNGCGVVGAVQETPVGAYDSWVAECRIQAAGKELTTL